VRRLPSLCAPSRAPAGGIYTCYLMYGIFQETLYKPQADKTTFAATAFVLFVQCLFNAAVSFVVDIAVGAATGSAAAPGKGAAAASGELAGSATCPRWAPRTSH
jgi:hypothetical protein